MPIRTYGLSGSGMDVDQLVSDMMKAQRIRYDSMAQKKTLAEWKKADLNSMYTSISSFKDSLFTYKLANTLSTKQAASSNESVVKVSANAEAVSTSHTIKVIKLANNANNASSANITAAGASKDTIAEQFYGDAEVPDDITFTISDGTNKKEITVDTSKSIFELVADINNSGTKIKASYNANVDRFFLYTTDTGSDTEISFSDMKGAGKSFLETGLKLTTDPVMGQDALFELDGATGITQKTNKFQISGVSYELTGEVGEAGPSTTITVSADTEKAVTAVKSFVEAYNTLLSTINGKLAEPRYKDYAPLTSDERKALSESEIKALEEKAKSGLLRRNTVLESLVYSMRNSVANAVAGLTGKYNSMATIGISTGVDYGEKGKLYIDEKELKAAMEKDPDIVYKIFAADGDDSSKQGVVRRLTNNLNDAMDRIVLEAGYGATTKTDTQSTLAVLIRDYDKNLTAFNDKLTALETRYYNQFNAMEAALRKLSQQSTWLAQQLGQ